MNIAYLTDIKSDLAESGGNVHVTQLARNLFSRGHRLYSNILDESNQFIKFRKKDFISKGEEIDVFYIRIHGHPRNDELTLFRAVNPKAPCIWEINAPLEEMKSPGISDRRLGKHNKRRIKIAQKMVNGAICVSEEIEAYAQKVLGIQNTCIIENGSDPVLFYPSKANDHHTNESKKFTVLWVGSPQYQCQANSLVLELARRMEDIDPDILFILTDEGLSKGNIRFLGKVPYSDMPKHVGSANIGLCLYEPISFYDHFYFSPLKLYDYMASGLPVIGNDLGQIRNVINNYQCGYLTDGSINDIIKKIILLKKNNKRAQKMGRNGREGIIQKHNWENVAHKTELFILDLITLQEEDSRPYPERKVAFYRKRLRDFLKPLIQR